MPAVIRAASTKSQAEQNGQTVLASSQWQHQRVILYLAMFTIVLSRSARDLLENQVAREASPRTKWSITGQMTLLAMPCFLRRGDDNPHDRRLVTRHFGENRLCSSAFTQYFPSRDGKSFYTPRTGVRWIRLTDSEPSQVRSTNF